MRDTTHILLQGVPRGLDLAAIRKEIAKTSGVESVHDLHVWSVAGDDANLTAHVVLRPAVNGSRTLAAMASMLKEKFGIEHATVHVETNPCEEVGTTHE